MILAIDIGNTNIVYGVISDDKIYFTARTSTDRTITDTQYAIQIKNILNLYSINISDINDCIISSVVPPVSSYVKNAVRLVFGHEAMLVEPGMKTGLNIMMDNPAQVGSDLIVSSVAALAEYEPPIIIIDMGTATTVCAMDKFGNYIGGCIMPGVKVSMDALAAKAAQLNVIGLEAPVRCIGKNTIDSMKSGIIFGSAAMIDGMLERIEDELEQKATAVATGGIAPLIIPHCKKKITLDNDLILKGLLLLYKRNKRS